MKARWILALLALVGCRPLLPAPAEPWVATPNEAFRTAPPALAPFPPLVIPETWSTTLPSGLKLVVVDRPGDLVAVRYFSRRGGTRETAGAPNATGLTLRLMRSMGSMTNLGMTGEVKASSLWLGGMVLPEDAPLAVRTLAEVIIKQAADQELLTLIAGFDRKDKVNAIRHPIQQSVYQSLRWLMGEADALGVSANQRVALLEDFRLEHVQAAHARMFAPEDGLVVLVGPVRKEDAQRWVEEAFGDWPASGRPHPQLRPPAPIGGKPGIHFLRAAPSLGVMVQGFPFPAIASAEYAAHHLFWLIHAKLFSSRLNLAVREEAGHSYGVNVEDREWAGGGVDLMWSIVAEDAMEPVLRRVLAENARIAKEPVSAEELLTAKSMVRSQLRTNLETATGTAATIDNLAIHDLELSWLAEYDRQIAAVTADQLRRAAATALKNASPIVVSGRPDEVASQLDDLGVEVLYEKGTEP